MAGWLHVLNGESAAGTLRRSTLQGTFLTKAEQRREERVYVGDAWFWTRVETLAAPPRPLVILKVEPRNQQMPEGTVAITEWGREVLSGGADRAAIAGIDRWLAGVHLTPGRLWRWDEERRHLSEPRPASRDRG